MIEQDYIIRMIKDMIRVLLVFSGKDLPSVYDDEGLDNMLLSNVRSRQLPLKDRLQNLVDSREINEAENLLFEELDKGVSSDFLLALWFYSKVNRLDNESLALSNYSRQEIQEGILDCADKFGIDPALMSQLSV